MSEVVHVAMKAMRMMLREKNDPELVLISFPGSSGARVSIFRHSRSNSLYAVKCAQNSRTSLMDEIAKKEILVPYLREHLPKVLWCQVIDGFEVMISECRGVQTLHNQIMNSNVPHSRLLAVWREVSEALVCMWQASRHQYQEALCPRYFPARVGRILEGLRHVVIGDTQLSEYFGVPIVVNGDEYPSIAESIEKMARVGKPKMGVVCHGDPQPSNIIIGNGDEWYCVDWEWASSNQDWRMMLSHLYGWWSTRCLALMSNPTINVSGGRLEIMYEAFIPAHLQSYQKVALSVALAMSDGFLYEEDVRDINRFLSALYFGELRFLKLWGREAFASAMLAQAVITVNQLGRGCHHPFQLQQ